MTPKRNLFAELMEGVDSLAAAREGKITLRTTEVKAGELLPLREHVNLSETVRAELVEAEAPGAGKLSLNGLE